MNRPKKSGEIAAERAVRRLRRDLARSPAATWPPAARRRAGTTNAGQGISPRPGFVFCGEGRAASWLLVALARPWGVVQSPAGALGGRAVGQVEALELA